MGKTEGEREDWQYAMKGRPQSNWLTYILSTVDMSLPSLSDRLSGDSASLAR